MKAVSVDSLKHNPRKALRLAGKNVVVVMSQGRPEALLVGIDSPDSLTVEGVRVALATALFRDDYLSLARSARVARQPLALFITHLSRLAIPVVSLSAEGSAKDLDTLDEWLKAS